MLVRIARFGLIRSIQDERVGDAEVARMRMVAQRVDDPQIEPGQRLDARGRHVVQVARIGERAEAEAERLDVAVVLQERQRLDRPALPVDRQRASPALSSCMFEDRRIVAAGRLHEAIGEARHQHARGRVVGVDVEAAPRMCRNSPRRSSMPWVWSACSWV